MSELPRLVNLLIEFGEKLEGSVNKKYRAFIRSMLSMEALMKSINPKKVCIGKELIVFKLGLEAKSTKAIELSLSYLHVQSDLDRNFLCTNSSILTSPTIAKTL